MSRELLVSKSGDEVMSGSGGRIPHFMVQLRQLHFQLIYLMIKELGFLQFGLEECIPLMKLGNFFKEISQFPFRLLLLPDPQRKLFVHF